MNPEQIFESLRARSLDALRLAALLSLVASPAGAAQPPFDFVAHEITPSEGSSFFGRAMAMDGRTLLVGDVFDRGGLGSATIFFLEPDGMWTEQSRLEPADLTPGAEFGHAVAISGRRVLVGAPFDAPDGAETGSAYAYVRDGNEWTLEAKLTASDGEEDDEFGSAAALDGETLIVGAPGEDDAPGFPFGAGAAYVFNLGEPGWSEGAKLVASDRKTFSSFGNSAALDGATAILGAYKADAPDGETGAGAAYVFEGIGDEWNETVKISAESFSWLGYSVSLSGDLALVGAPLESGSFGAAHVLGRDQGGPDQWGDVGQLLGECPGQWFGYSTSLSGRFAVVGSLGRGTYLFQGDELVDQIVGEDCDNGLPGNDGYSVAISGTNFAVGAPFSGITGSVWTYSAGDRVWELFLDLPAPGDAGVDNLLRVNGSEFGRSLELYGGLQSGTTLLDSCTPPIPIEIGSWEIDLLEEGDTGNLPGLYAIEPESVFISYFNEDDGVQRLARSDDLGETWTLTDIEQTFGEDYSSSVVAVDGDTIFVSYEDTQDDELVVAHSVDGGVSWAPQVVDSIGDAGAGSSMEIVDGKRIFISYSVLAPEEDLRLARSLDGGATWTTTTVHSASRVGFWTSLEAVNDDTLFVSFHDAGSDSLLFARSDDAGETWTETVIDSGTKDTGFYSALYAVDENQVFLAYYDDVDHVDMAKLARSVDGGQTWDLSTVASHPDFGYGQNVSLHGIGADRLFMSWGGANHVVAESTDGGGSWLLQTADGDGDEGPIFALDADRVLTAYSGSCCGGSLRFAASTQPRLLGVVEADANGRAGFDLFVPLGLEGERVHFQVLERGPDGTCRVTNAVTHEF